MKPNMRMRKSRGEGAGDRGRRRQRRRQAARPLRQVRDNTPAASLDRRGSPPAERLPDSRSSERIRG
jgi:hypothetical protein